MTVTLGTQGIKTLKKYFQQQAKTMKALVEKIEIALAEKGLELLQANAPTYDIDGNITGSVSTEKSANGYKVVYSGEDVAYIEFGTGYKGESRPYPNTVALAEANWQYDVNGWGVKGWWYKSKRDGSIRYSQGGMYPEMPVYKSYKELEKVATSIIKGVLDDFFA